MGFWNRDRTDEPFTVWCDDCFPVYRPTTAEKFGKYWGTTTPEGYAAHVFGGLGRGFSPEDAMEHLIELALTIEHYADEIEDCLTNETRWTPEGYAWANWRMGSPCAVCGKDI